MLIVVLMMSIIRIPDIRILFIVNLYERFQLSQGFTAELRTKQYPDAKKIASLHLKVELCHTIISLEYTINM